MLPNIEELTQLVRHVAKQVIMPRFEQVGFELKQDGSLVTEADLAANQSLYQRLQQQWPHIAFLSEEMERSEQEALLQDADLLWCLDPLDGTSNFAAGFPIFATSLALVSKGKVVMGVTYDPSRDEMFSAVSGQGAWLNGRRLTHRPSQHPLNKTVALVDFKRLSPNLRHTMIHHPPFGSQRNLGTCAIELAWVAANRGHIYLHGSMKIWDLAVGSLLISEAGGRSCTLEGESVFRPTMDTRSVVAALDERLFNEWFAFVQAHR